MDSTEYIKSKIVALYEANAPIHINLRTAPSRSAPKNLTVLIKGVYRNIFQVAECEAKHPTLISLRYNDILSGYISVEELNYTPPSIK